MVERSTTRSMTVGRKTSSSCRRDASHDEREAGEDHGARARHGHPRRAPGGSRRPSARCRPRAAAARPARRARHPRRTRDRGRPRDPRGQPDRDVVNVTAVERVDRRQPDEARVGAPGRQSGRGRDVGRRTTGGADRGDEPDRPDATSTAALTQRTSAACSPDDPADRRADGDRHHRVARGRRSRPRTRRRPRPARRRPARCAAAGRPRVRPASRPTGPRAHRGGRPTTSTSQGGTALGHGDTAELAVATAIIAAWTPSTTRSSAS